MKKIVFLLVVIFLIAGVAFAKGPRDMDGFDWLDMPGDDKARVAQGFLMGIDVFKLLHDDVGMPDDRKTKEYINQIYFHLKFDTITPQEIVRRLNYFYDRNPHCHDWPVQQVILIMFEKNWWDYS